MLSLIPTELWHYTIRDIVRGLLDLRKSGKQENGLFIPGLGDGIPIRSARAAVIVALKALGMRPGARIGVPLYCCPVVFKAVKAADCTLRFIDIDPDTFCLSPNDLSVKSTDIDAVIAVHMFGNLCDMPSIMAAMNGKPVIEDCAQSLGSLLHGRVSGSFGHVSFFSFRSGKYLSVGEGGALYSREMNLYARISELVAALPSPGRTDELKHVVMTYARSKLRSKPLWGLMGSRIWGIYNKKTEFSDKSPISLGKIFASDLTTVRYRMAFLDSMIISQRANAGYYECHLHVSPAKLYFEKSGTFYNRFMYPITFPSSEHRDAMMKYLQGHSISTAKPYEDVIKGAAEHYGYGGDCPVAEQMLKNSLIIPSYYTLRPLEVERIVDCVNNGWAESKSSD